MIKKIPQLRNNVFYVGVNDRKKQLFENIWPIESGVAYNSYLITDEKTVLIDTVDSSFIMEYISTINQCLKGKTLDYLIVNHMEPDHCGAIQIIKKYFPDVKIVGNKKTFEMLNNFFGMTSDLLEVKEGDELDLGSRTLKFYMAPMVHWPEVMMTYDTKDHTLFSADAFGSFGTLDGGITDEEINLAFYEEEFIRYYSNIVGKFANPVQAILKKFKNMPIKMVASTHGPIFKKHDNIWKLISLYDKLSRHETDEGVVIAYASMYGNTEAIAEVIARDLAENGITNIRIYDVSKTHPSYIIRDIFKYKGLILGSPTYNLGLHPNMAALISKLEDMGIKNHVYGCFGTYSWAGKAAKNLEEFGHRMGWEMIGPTIEEKGSLKIEKFTECIAMAYAMAERLKQ
jgi:flavorubredoxin